MSAAFVTIDLVLAAWTVARSVAFSHCYCKGGRTMFRRSLLLLAVLACAALAAAPSVHAQDPTIVTDITFPEGGEPFGTFTASDPLCPSGTSVDEFVSGGRRAVTIRKRFVCADGSGTFTIQFHPQSTNATTAGCEQSGPFAVTAEEPAITPGSVAPASSACSTTVTASTRPSREDSVSGRKGRRWAADHGTTPAPEGRARVLSSPSLRGGSATVAFDGAGSRPGQRVGYESANGLVVQALHRHDRLLILWAAPFVVAGRR